MARDLIFEIGTEEMPANDMNSVRKSFQNTAIKIFSDNRLHFSDCRVYSTPRRLTLYIKGMAEKQKDKKESVRGPAEAIAFDDDGNPTKAGSGFARGQGVDVEDLIIRDDYVYVDKVEKGKNTAQLLTELLPEIIKNIDFSKSMRWGNVDFRFIRPIKWLLALYGEETINFTIAGVKSDNYSSGHRFLGEEKVEINEPDQYFEELEKNFVITDHKRRKDLIVYQIEKISEELGEVMVLDELLSEVVDLVEYPTSFYGNFEDNFLKLPDDVLITSMVEHQRYFPVKDETGDLTSHFVAVRDGNREHLDEVQHGNEMVIKARLSDAQFFFEEDMKKTLADRKEELKDIVFQKGLGSMYDKVERIKEYAVRVGENLKLESKDISVLEKAVDLCKNDLVTEMVNEFSKLQGIIGQEYALLNGRSEEVATAISEHYLPRFADDKLPETIYGQILSIVDKMDNIISHFSQGIKPSGSQDPYALRRQGTGVVRILADSGLNLSITQLIEWNMDILGVENDELSKEIKDFILKRIEKVMEENNIRYDVINAVIAVNNEIIYDILARSEAIMDIREENPSLFIDLFRGLVRAKNLAENSDEKLTINSELLQEEGERELYREYNKIKDIVEDQFGQENYKKGLKSVVELKQSIDKFLDNVIVMVEDEKIKRNRLALLQKVAGLVEPVMDIEEIALDD